jgi:hypothetical protein
MIHLLTYNLLEFEKYIKKDLCNNSKFNYLLESRAVLRPL